MLSERYATVRTNLYLDIFHQVAHLKGASQELIDLTRHITLWRTLFPQSPRITRVRSTEFHTNTSEALGLQTPKTAATLLPEEDLRRFGTPSRIALDETTHQLIVQELDKIIVSIANFVDTDLDDLSAEEKLDRARRLPQDIQSLLDEGSSLLTDLDAIRKRIQELLAETEECHKQLKQNLTLLISTYPPNSNRKRSASNDLLATTIETSLIKLSVLRARAHKLLYGSRSTSNPNATVGRALESAHAQLKKDEAKLYEEERKLDQQIEEYEGLLRLVDGGAGGFAQVVEDWVTVQRETEECRKDLRRLGWTGD